MGLMPTYPNGFVPRSKLVVFHTGTDKDGRYYEWRLPPSTYRKYLALVARAERRTGRILVPSTGWACDRPYAEQVYSRSVHGIWAAKPGTSSHGGCWAGPVTGWRLVDTAAIDFGNWAWVYQNHGLQDAFFADCRAVGLTPGGISKPAFPDEPWHVIDLDPWAPVPADSGAVPLPEQEEETMRIIRVEPKDAPKSFYVISIDDAEKIGQAEASALKVAGVPVEPVTPSQASTIIAGIKRRRSRSQDAYAAVVDKALDDDLAKLAKLHDPDPAAS